MFAHAPALTRGARIGLLWYRLALCRWYLVFAVLSSAVLPMFAICYCVGLLVCDLLVCRDRSNTKIAGPGVFLFGDLSVGGHTIGFSKHEKGSHYLAQSKLRKSQLIE